MPSTEFAHSIWQLKYRADQERTPADSWRRVATAIAGKEADAAHWQSVFLDLLHDQRFLPGGRILAGAGTARQVTLFNCFVLGLIPDDMAGIFDSLREGALTMQAGGGVGYDFSTLRPQGTIARSTGNIASGPVSFMHIWNAMCGTLLTTGARRGAMIASLRCDHPDIELFIDAKRDNSVLNHFNLSVQVSDAFMQAVQADQEWALVFPAGANEETGQEILVRDWPGQRGKIACVVHKRIAAKTLWHKLMQANHDSGEPGVLFTDRINAMNNLHWREQLTCTNPCGEIPLPPYGACDLGSLNLPRFVHAPFTSKATLDLVALAECATVATRMLDNVIDCSHFPLPQQQAMAQGTRRIGLGITGLGDALIMLGLHYGSEQARQQAATVMQTICHAAYRSSIRLAQEKGSFPYFECEPYLQSRFVQSLPADIIEGINKHGIRNSHLLAIAPTGTISLLADNISSGIEPVFAFEQIRTVLEPDGSTREVQLENACWRQWLTQGGDRNKLPGHFVTALQLDARDHLLMQAELQPFVDNAISKTINVPAWYRFDAFTDLYNDAYRLGLKGCTTFRDGCRRDTVLRPAVKGCAECENW